ncbi:MAG: DUF3037 domain-containing protein [Planctomycetes bacterium]|nr:DUF3037 domain-containing protein [Planctomycetota bacterium]
MPDTRGYYGVIQYCPNPSRAEGANVGVLLCCPEVGFLETSMSAGNDRVRRFFRGESLDLERLQSAKQAFASRLRQEQGELRTIEQLQRFIETRAGDLRIVAPRPIRVSEPKAELDSLFLELVGGRAKRQEHEPKIPELDRLVRSPTLAPRLLFDHRVRVPILDLDMRVPYAYQNGVLNLIKPYRFGSSEEKAVHAAGRWALRGDLLQRSGLEGHGSGKRKLIMVCAFTKDPALHITQHVGRVFQAYEIRVVAEAQVPEFVAEIEREAHLPQKGSPDGSQSPSKV